MDWASLVAVAVSAIAAVASAIIALFARADSLSAARRADAAERAALSAWRDTADALLNANAITERQHLERLNRERLLRRVEAAEPLRRWLLKRTTEIADVDTSNQEVLESTELEEMSMRVIDTGEPNARSLIEAVRIPVAYAPSPDFEKPYVVHSMISGLISEWIRDPEGFEEIRDDITYGRPGAWRGVASKR
jgi:hypothetical protein